MTVEDRYVIDAADLTHIRLECTNPKCATTVTIHVDSFQQPPQHCPGCHAEWIGRGMMSEADKRRDHQVRQLVTTIRELRRLATDADAPFRMRLEADLEGYQIRRDR